MQMIKTQLAGDLGKQQTVV